MMSVLFSPANPARSLAIGSRSVVSRRPVSPEFSRLVAAEKIGRDGLVLELKADADERAALARRFGLEALDNFEGRARLVALGNGQIRLEVTFDADVLQSCVITLEPVASHISDRFEIVYAPITEGENEREVFVDVTSEEPPEPLLEGRIDIGEMMAQHLAMLIDPYPRLPDAPEGSWRTNEEDGAAAAARPFEKLKQWMARSRD